MASRKRPSNSKNSRIDEKLDKLASDIKQLPERRKKILEELMQKRLYDSKETCEILGISQPSLRRAIQLRRIKTVKVGRFLRIPAEEIKRIVGESESLLNVQECAELLNVSPITIRSLIKSGKIEAIRFADAGPFKIRKNEIERIASEGIKD